MLICHSENQFNELKKAKMKEQQILLSFGHLEMRRQNNVWVNCCNGMTKRSYANELEQVKLPPSYYYYNSWSPFLLGSLSVSRLWIIISPPLA